MLDRQLSSVVQLNGKCVVSRNSYCTVIRRLSHCSSVTTVRIACAHHRFQLNAYDLCVDGAYRAKELERYRDKWLKMYYIRHVANGHLFRPMLLQPRMTVARTHPITWILNISAYTSSNDYLMNIWQNRDSSKNHSSERISFANVPLCFRFSSLPSFSLSLSLRAVFMLISSMPFSRRGWCHCCCS